LASGQTIIDDWYITCYNLIFTAFPLFISATTDSDIDLNDEKEKKKNFALLYRENRDTYKIFSFSVFLKKIIKGVIVSFVIFGFCLINEILNNGRTYSIWYLSLKCYISTLIIVSINLLMANNFIVYLLPLTIGITTFLLFIVFLILNHYGVLFSFNSKASIFPSLTSLITYLSIFIVCFFSGIVDYTWKLGRIYFNNSLSSKLLLERANKKQRKSFFGFSSKSYTKHSKDKRKDNLSLEQRSKSYFESQTPKNQKLNLMFHNKSPNSKKNSTHMRRTEYKI
jgi:magnesium-transporting ATPase (P-type)